MIGPTCPTCGRIHGTDCVIALRRFLMPDVKFKARFEDAPERDTRAKAEADYCHHQATKEES